VEDFWRAHQIPVLDPATNKQNLKLVENWMRSYQPEELFDANGTLIPEFCRNWRPPARAASLPIARQWRTLRKELDLPDFRQLCGSSESAGRGLRPPTTCWRTSWRK